MMNNFCQLTEAESGDIVFINPLLVRTIRTYGDEKTTWIEFDIDHKILVNMAPEQVAQMLIVS
jgi:regulator of extracellular matrix RemA (YlzA/DUF370 family)